ncbi:DUF1707 SHOCT-like domain-containing protein [Nonomuraea zeae]|uniref:DUF1707 domain-containing protein n=1 Tax=Nonomuraea zeae TaxID=1642303 RepID=A0A5S4F5C4_9ACTN|nr:DUF1707 domain-containing protein [Nonomuraea zeae]TMR11332.1 DUF1707 domain-containing protein [Nonomuraea zeae]
MIASRGESRSGAELVRLSDTDRDRAVQRLQQAFADGRLTSGEMEARLERALTAASRGELEPALAGLTEEVVRITTTGARIKRSGEWRVPRALRVDSEFGRVRLDLSEALIVHPEIDIELRLAYGSATIILPPGASADADGARSEWGRVTCTASQLPRPGRPHVRVTGELSHGRLKIRHSHAWFGAGR